VKTVCKPGNINRPENICNIGAGCYRNVSSVSKTGIIINKILQLIYIGCRNNILKEKPFIGDGPVACIVF